MLETLADAIDADGTTVDVDLPDGWQSLGAASGPGRYSNTLTVAVNGNSALLRVRRAIDQPVGMFLTSPETNPVDISDGEQTMWHVAGGTTPGWNTLVSVRNGTLVEISGEAPLEVLVEVASSLEPVPAVEWLDVATGEVNDNPSMTIEGTEAGTCEQRTLTIIE